jgi:NADH-quinone oxidoreductase subunit C
MTTAIEQIKDRLTDKIKQVQQYAGEVTFIIDALDVPEVMQILKKQFGYNYLADIHAIDHYRDEARFELVYNIVNIENKQRLRIKCTVEEDYSEIDSVVSVWPSANWNEREVYDMMGIRFRGHPDLRRMFMPEDFEYFPLRKEFPLIGIPGSIELPEKDAPKGYR